MYEANAAPLAPEVANEMAQPQPSSEPVVSTHVLVPERTVEKLRELSRRTRVAQSEYLREAVDDLLLKYREDAKEKP